MATRDLRDAFTVQVAAFGRRRRFGPRRLVLLLLLTLLGGAILPACSLPHPDAVDCTSAPTQVITALSTRLTTPGHLRNGRVVHETGEGMYFVSAEFIPTGKDDHYDGDILTWATSTLSGDGFRSVGTQAQHESSWPQSSITVTADGPLLSRGCTYPVVGKQPLSQCQQAAAAAGLSRLCSHLPSGQ